MMSLKLTRVFVLGGAVLLAFAPAALGALSLGANPATTAGSATTPLATGGENTPLNLGGTTATHAASGSSSGLLRTVIGLVIVVALIYGVSWILKRVRRSGGGASGNGLTQLASLPLGGGRSIALVRAGKEVVLVGVAEHGVTPIRTYTEAEVIAGGIDLPQDQTPDYEPTDDRALGLLQRLRRLTVRS